ncbi:Crp/Fnr family transcriptional regulator [Imperialibacter roseus]|uniref:Crp/Fnr family transcriptional regulator n=1 Tax=Imperialibacter roseus TaxID=1324217 RepID=A0ABZ0IXM7_9BACT|nr:Crp/Fnr family transcriptional regulator [Imperialibacter roseus]WOK09159.1 Crp/Fnr family transcriptional regulator [Imperialibacter roseus]
MYREIIYNKYHLGGDFLIEGLSAEEKVLLESKMISHIYKKGQVIFRAGMTPTGVYLLNKGKVKKYTTGDDGKQHIFYICNSGEALGYHSLLSEEPYPDFAETLEDSTLAFIPKDVFLMLIDRSKQLSQKLLKSLSHEFTVFIHSTTVFAQKTVRERLALSLLMLKEKYRGDDSQDGPVEITILREDLANIVGTAIETLVRLLRDFKEEQIIETKGRTIVILHPGKLVKIANFY